MTITELIDAEIGIEGGYSNNPNDPGHETKWGITVENARLSGYMGEMKDMPRETAFNIYAEKFVTGPHFDQINNFSPAIARVLVDAGINQGVPTASGFLQEALNIFNRQGRDYADIHIDYNVGQHTIDALRKFLQVRVNNGGEAVMVKALNCLRGARYIRNGEQNPKLEDFEFGWFANRI